MSDAELTINVTDFKAKCLGIIDQLQDGRLTRVTLTRRGKPAAVLTPPVEDKPYVFNLEEYQASLGEDRLEYDPTFDGSEPFLDEQSLAEWEEKISRLGEWTDPAKAA